MGKSDTVKDGLEDGENGNEEPSCKCSLHKTVEIKGHEDRREEERVREKAGLGMICTVLGDWGMVVRKKPQKKARLGKGQ